MDDDFLLRFAAVVPSPDFQDGRAWGGYQEGTLRAGGVHNPVGPLECPFVMGGQRDGVDVVVVLTHDEVGAHVDVGQADDFGDGFGLSGKGKVKMHDGVAAVNIKELLCVHTSLRVFLSVPPEALADGCVDIVFQGVGESQMERDDTVAAFDGDEILDVIARFGVVGAVPDKMVASLLRPFVGNGSANADRYVVERVAAFR